MTPTLVLIVEDNFDIRESIEQLLLIEGYSVLTASDGQDALNILSSSKCLPRVILLDLLMPELSGWDFLAKLRDQNAYDDIEVVVMTAMHFSAEKLAGFQINAASVLRKPIDAHHLLEMVSKATSN